MSHLDEIKRQKIWALFLFKDLDKPKVVECASLLIVALE